MKLGKFRLDGFVASLLRRPWSGMYSDGYIYSLLPRQRSHLWIVAAPKSGSTWLSVLLKRYLGWETRSLVFSFDRREQEPSLRALAEAASHEHVLWKHLHTRASQSTLDLIQRAGILPIIQTRRLDDTLVSLGDHFDSESTTSSLAYMDDAQWGRLDGAARQQFLVDMAAPWYFNFYAGWFSSELVRSGAAYICRYEELREDPARELLRICADYGLPTDPERADAAVAYAATQFTRKNRGIVGRGAGLTDEQRESLTRMRHYYADIDFSKVGFPD